jgi:ADP-ribose pyrophosphatase
MGTAPLYQGFFRMVALTLRHRLYSGGWSAPMTREVFERGDAVAILLYDPDRDVVVLVEQFRVGTLRHGGPHWMVEVVAGIQDDGESAEDVARREAREEAGCPVGAVERISTFYPSPGGCTERITLFCGRVDSRGITGIHGLAEEHEDIRVLPVPAEAAIDALDRDLIRNGITLVALGWLARHRGRLRREWAGLA